MNYYRWTGIGDFDLFLHCPAEEVELIADCFPRCSVESASFGSGDGFYYLINSQNKTISPLPFLALAFGGQYNDDPPYGEEVHNVKPDFNEYRLERFYKEKMR